MTTERKIPIKTFLKNLFFLILFLPFAAYSQGKVDLSLKESTLFWKGNYVTGYSGHEGTLQFVSGMLMQASNSKITGGSFVLDMNSLKNTDLKDEKGQKNIEEHLRSKDFFETQLYPTASFIIVKIEPTAQASTYEVTGNLTLKGITHRISITAAIIQTNESISVKAEYPLNRTLWGITYKAQNMFDFGSIKNDLISNTIFIKIDMVFRKK